MSAPLIYREYSYTKRWGETDPSATHPFQVGNPRRQPKPLAGVDLEHAIRAEMCIEYWGGHFGTTGKSFQVNGHDWIAIPQPEGTPDEPIYYHCTLLGHPPVEVPLDFLRSGDNEVVFAAGPQQKRDFGYGFFWVYAFTLRVYYDAEVAHPRGAIAYPVQGAVLGDDPVLAVEVDASAAPVSKVEYLGHYHDYDWEGNGCYTDWHGRLEKGELHAHLGTGVEAPFSAIWENRWVPEQPDGMKVKARLHGENGVIFETPVVEGVVLRRHDRVVRLFPGSDIPEGYGASRAQRSESSIIVDRGSAQPSDARLALSCWSGLELTEAGVNDHPITGPLGREIDYSFHLLPVPPEAVREGQNTFYAFSFADYHKVEINWPGPALLLEWTREDSEVRAAREETLLNALKHAHTEVRVMAARDLGLLGASTAVAPLIQALEDEAWEVRKAAAKALGQIGDPAATEPLILLLLREKPFTPDVWKVRHDAAQALAQMRGPEAEDVLRKYETFEDRILPNYIRYALERVDA